MIKLNESRNWLELWFGLFYKRDRQLEPSFLLNLDSAESILRTFQATLSIHHPRFFRKPDHAWYTLYHSESIVERMNIRDLKIDRSNFSVSKDHENDINYWRNKTPEERMVHSLNDFGLPEDVVDSRRFTNTGQIVWCGVPQLRIEILTEIDGIAIDEYGDRETKILVDENEVSIISFDHPSTNKNTTKRS